MQPTTTSPSTDETNSKMSFLIGAASVTVVCIVFGIGLLYRYYYCVQNCILPVFDIININVHDICLVNNFISHIVDCT